MNSVRPLILLGLLAFVGAGAEGCASKSVTSGGNSTKVAKPRVEERIDRRRYKKPRRRRKLRRFRSGPWKWPRGTPRESKIFPSPTCYSISTSMSSEMTRSLPSRTMPSD